MYNKSKTKLSAEGALEYSQSIGMKMLSVAVLKLFCSGHMNIREANKLLAILSGQDKYGGNQ